MKETAVSENCQKMSTCYECLAEIGCGWCADPSIDLQSRCDSWNRTQIICPASEYVEPKSTTSSGEPEVIMRTAERIPGYPEPGFYERHIRLDMSVGDVKYLRFHYWHAPGQNRVNISQRLPEGVELKLFSTCNGRQVLRQITACSAEGTKVGENFLEFNARFHMKSCPKNPYWWRDRPYKLMDDVYNNGVSFNSEGKIFISFVLCRMKLECRIL